MAEVALQERANQQSAPTERGADWTLATTFFSSVAALYALLAYAVYLVIT